MNQRETKYWALRKWRRCRDNGMERGVEFDIPQLNEFEADCSYCEIYWKDCKFRCQDCPVKVDGLPCNDYFHPYSIPEDQKNFFPLMIDLIRGIEVPSSTEEQFFVEE